MKVIITGATGALGRALTLHYSGKGDEVIATGRMKNPPANLLKHAMYICADITEQIELPEADVCIHAAALSDDKGAEKDLYVANVTGTENVVRALKPSTTFIHISSSSVYLPTDSVIKEEIAGNQDRSQLSGYGKSKLLSEEKLVDISSFERCYILRPRALYGAGDIKILPRMLKLVKKDKIFRPGSMEVNVSMTHYSNLCHAIDCCITSEKKGIHTYNVADNDMYILIDVLRSLTKEIYGSSLEEKHVPIALLKLMATFGINGMSKLLVRSLTKDMVLDTSKIRSELKYDPSTTFDSRVKEIGDWVKRAGGVELVKGEGKELAWVL